MTGIKIGKRKINTAFLSGITVMAIYLLILLVRQIAPFGDNTWLMFDMKRQYIDYYSYLRTVTFGDNSLFYSFSTALGSGMFGFDTYYLTSPFLILTYLFPQSLLPVAVTLIIGIKLVIASVIMCLFLEHFKGFRDEEVRVNDNPYVIFLLAVTWGLNGFLVAHSMNMMWTDVIIMLPLIVWALENLLRDKKRLPYIFCLAAMLFLNYYITYQILLFTGLWTILRLYITKDKHPFKQIGRVILNSITAAALDAVFLLPTALELVNSPKDITKLGLEASGKNLIIRDVLSKLPSLSYDYIEARFGEPQIFIGVLFLIVGIMFFADCHRTKRERIGYGVMLIIFLASFCRDILNLIWHAGMEPSGHPYRQAFMCVFVMLICCYESLQDIVEDLEKCEEAAPKKRYLTALAIAFLLLSIMFYEVLRLRYDHISPLTQAVNWALLIIYTIVLLFIFLLMGKEKKKKTTYILMSLLMCMQLGDLAANGVYIHYWQSSNGVYLSEYRNTIENTKEASDWIKDRDSSFYRVENLNPRQQNDSMQYNYKGVTHYSSAGMIYVRYFLQRMGFNDDKLYTHYGHDNTVTADSILGIKYLLTDGTYEAHDTYDLVRDGEVQVYANPYALAVAIAVKDYDTEGISSEVGLVNNDASMAHLGDMDPFALQEDVYGRITGQKEDIFKEPHVSKESKVIDTDETDIYRLEPVCDGNVYMYIKGISDKSQSLGIYEGEEFISGYGNEACLKVLNLGYRKKGETFDVSVVGMEDDPDLGEAIFVTEDMDALKDAYMRAASGAIDIDMKNSAHLEFSTTECNGIFMTIPAEEGWHIKVDGKKISPLTVYDSLMYIPMNETGVHKVNMYFIPDGLGTGGVITLIMVLILLAEEVYRKKNASSVTEKSGEAC